MHDEADVGLVDAHPECAGRHHDPRAAAHEAFLDLLALAGGELAVITACVDAVRDEETVEVLDGADGRGVDDPAPFFLAKDAQEGFALRCTIHRAQDFVPQVRTLDSEVDDLGAGHSELANDVFHYLPRRRRREGKDRRPFQRANGVGQGEIGGAEVVSPLRDAVGLVDHEQRDAACAQQIEVLGILQALRRHVDEVVGAVRDLFRRLALLACRQRRVELRHLDARGLRLLLLVLHQRKQRRDDDDRLRQEECGKLVGERLPGAGGQETERIAAPERSFEQLLLSRAKRSHRGPA